MQEDCGVATMAGEGNTVRDSQFRGESVQLGSELRPAGRVAVSDQHQRVRFASHLGEHAHGDVLALPRLDPPNDPDGGRGGRNPEGLPGGQAGKSWSREVYAGADHCCRAVRVQVLLPCLHRTGDAWWERPIVCGWGHQSYQGDLFRIRSSPERPPDNAVYTLCTQATYRDIVERLDDRNISWGTLVIDARWFLAGGLKNVDTGRWPDLRGFVDAQHRQGRKVLLWWGPWDPDGVPEAECIRYQPEAGLTRENRPGRMAKFGTPQPGRKLAIDITLPQVRRRVREQVRLLLSSDGFDADGLKLDHVSAAPGVYGMAFPEGSGRLFGIEATRSCLALIYEAAKEAKPDALVIGQSPTPYLADVQDMLRLGDIYSVRADSVAAVMAFRASMARQVDPDWLIDTDGWPLPSLAAMREYIDMQPSLGVPSLYYVTHLDTTGEALGASDYAHIRKAWSARSL